LRNNQRGENSLGDEKKRFWGRQMEWAWRKVRLYERR